MGLSLRDIWVQPRNRPVNEMGLMPAGSRHVWIQTDDLDAQGTIIVPVCLNETPHIFHHPIEQPGSKDIYKVRFQPSSVLLVP